MPSLDQLPGNAGVITGDHGSRAKFVEAEFSPLEQGVHQVYAVPDMLAVVGHGTSVAGANAEAAKLARMVKNRHLNPQLLASLNASDHVNNNITHQRSSLPRQALTTTLEQK